MCGLTGFWEFKQATTNDLEETLRKMSSTLMPRGPDSEGTWVDANSRLGMGHRRLAIQDLSLSGHQPMHSASGRFVIAYNGEMFNAEEIREEFAKTGKHFKGHSDTEVLVEACDTWGVTKAVKKMVGMFAFALWDRKEQTLYLVRDRLGIKPLYWGIINNVLFFGSQPKSFRPHPKFEAEIDSEALPSYFRFNYIPGPFSIYKDINKLEPGHILEINANGIAKKNCYWDLPNIALAGVSSSKNLSTQEWIERLESLLKDSIKKRMISDVPLGAFLSGGIDSSTVVALMQAQSDRPIKTFSIGFHEQGYNEAQHAKEVAQHLGTDHHEQYLSAKQAQDIIPSLAEWYDEPFADSSQIPTYLVSRMAREHVTVCLSGDGGDELFAGYNRYFVGLKIWNRIKHCPPALRNVMAASIRLFSPNTWDMFGKFIPESKRPSLLGDKAHKFADILEKSSAKDYYLSLVSQWQNPRALVLGQHETFMNVWKEEVLSSEHHFLEWMQLQDMLTYLPEDILAKVDRASMAVSLEARVPIIDHRVVELSWQIPRSLKIRNGKSKWILREILKKYVPEELFDRPKMGFGVPIGDWLRDDKALRPWAEELLNPQKIRQQHHLNASLVQKKWEEHLSGKRNWQHALWSILMFQAWLEDHEKVR